VNRDDPSSVTAEDLQRFIVFLRQKKAWSETPHAKDRPLSATSINTYVRGIRSFWNWMLSQKMIDSNPLAGVSAPKLPKTLPKIFTEDELRTILQTVWLEPLNKAMILVLLDSGVRLSELVGLTLGSIDLNRCRLRVIGKGAKERIAYISDITADALAAYFSQRQKTQYQGSQLWVSAEGRVLTGKRVQKILEGIGKRSGLTSRLSAHKLRHTYATLSLKYGLNMEYLKRTMGHEDIETTSNSYLNVADEDISRAYQEASPVSHLFKPAVLPIDKQQLPRGKEAVIKQEPYEETPHERKMRELAKALAGRISLPSPWDKDLWRDLPVDFQPGKYYLPVGAVEIGEDKQIKVNYYDIGAGIAEPHLVKGLFSHLGTSESSKFAELAGDKGKLNNLVGETGQYSQALLKFLKLIVDEVKGYRAKVFSHDEAKPGLAKSFIVTAWKDAILKATGYSWITDSWYKPHESIPGTNLWQLRCGPYIIGIAESKKTLKTYENWHKKLRVKYAKNKLAQDIAAKYQELNDTAQDIGQRLQEFSDMRRLPGHCELC
jgi:integrase/recombinase XerC